VPTGLLGTAVYKNTTTNGQTLRVVMRKELVGLWQLAFQICDVKYHYPIWAQGPQDGKPWGPWGYDNRPISGTQRASGHSVAVSVDINAPYNPYSYTFVSNMPPPMVADLESLGMYWGGRYVGQKYDAMHFGFCRKPAAVAAYIVRARAILGQVTPPKPPSEEDMPLNDADKKYISDTVHNALNKFFNQDKSVNTTDVAATPNHQDYTVTGALERLIRIETLDATGQPVKFHPE
jgi:hypothetical protein